MIPKTVLCFAVTFAAGLLFVNVYTSMVDAVSWGSNIPGSIQTARDYFKSVNPGNFFRIFSPINQLLALLALIFCWKSGKRVRIFCGLGLAVTVMLDVFTFGYFYPRNEIMFMSSIDEVEAIKMAWSQWSGMNWVRSGLSVVNLVVDFAALTTLLDARN
ncbi:MAG: DUF1772 domain-containing protein [Bacteroidetes bacterium]|nr:DUF1772 domain-containing protein [Bacteroidota bacterium]